MVLQELEKTKAKGTHSVMGLVGLNFAPHVLLLLHHIVPPQSPHVSYLRAPCASFLSD